MEFPLNRGKLKLVHLVHCPSLNQNADLTVPGVFTPVLFEYVGLIDSGIGPGIPATLNSLQRTVGLVLIVI